MTKRSLSGLFNEDYHTRILPQQLGFRHCGIAEIRSPLWRNPRNISKDSAVLRARMEFGLRGTPCSAHLILSPKRAVPADKSGATGRIKETAFFTRPKKRTRVRRIRNSPLLESNDWKTMMLPTPDPKYDRVYERGHSSKLFDTNESPRFCPPRDEVWSASK